MMAEDCRGSKRRLSDADESERLSQRQMILNMSICKMQRDNGKVEPRLLRTVLITNTVRRIEKEMEEEMSFNSDKADAALFSSFAKSFGPAADANWRKKDTANAASEPSSPADLEESFADIGLDIKPVASTSITNNNTSCPPGKDGIMSADGCAKTAAVSSSNKFGCIGDGRRNGSTKTTNETHFFTAKTDSAATTAHYYLPNFILPSIFDIMDDACMAEFTGLPTETDALMSGVNQLWSNDDWKALPDVTTAASNFPLVHQGSCASEVEKLKGDSFFEDLDQIMQVLVGM